MNEGEAFLAQARSDLRVFEILLDQDGLEMCHSLHYLQMASEKLAKAISFARVGSVPYSHVAISRVTTMLSRRSLADALGFKNRHEAFAQFLKQAMRFFDGIEKLCPALAGSQKHSRDMPNAEYPWKLPAANEWQAPCNFHFTIGASIQVESNSRQALRFLKTLAARFDELF